MYLDNKYSRIYYDLIDRAKTRTISGYTEKHHIIPKSLGGSNDKENLVELTAREHFICHRLLIKMVIGNERIRMLHALGKFVQSNHLQPRNLTSKHYEVARLAIIEARTGTKRPGIGGAKRGNVPWNKGIRQGNHSDESNKQRSLTMKTKPMLQCKHCGKTGKGNVMFRYHFDNCKARNNIQ